MYVSKVYEMAVDSYGDVRTLVRGLPYQCPYDWEDVLDSLDEDSNLYLIKEPDNPKDKLAIAAYLDDRRIGYVAASDNGKIWLYMTDEKMPCQFIERFEASFKIAFENPRPLFEDMPFKEIYKDKFGVTEQSFPAFDIPFLSNPKDKRYEWFDDRIYIADLERAIPDFRRKLATRMIIIAGRKDSKGEYNYYLPYANNPIADVEDEIIKGIIDRYGFVIALPDVPVINTHGGISMDIHVTFLKNTNFKDYNLAFKSELVFCLVRSNEYKHQFAEDNPSTLERNDYSDEKQNNVMEEDDMFMQEAQSTPSYSKSDYILKKGEVTTSSIDKSTFTEIDQFASELYSFVRQTLFPSMELFSYLKKHTPYYDQFYDFGQFETLIRVFVIKDLGRIYKGLNHSFNFDTAEGKALFLYMEKDTGENPETSYEAFNEICNPKTRLEAATKMRGVIENLMKSFYEYDIALWTDTDFIIHSFLKDVDDELAKRYMKLIRQFASAVSGEKEQARDSSLNSTKETFSVIDEFFPLFGITIGKTTLEQAEDMGGEIKNEGPNKHVWIGRVKFVDNEGGGIISSLDWFFHYVDFPQSWKSKGFSWDNSYKRWKEVFKELGFDVTVTQEPTYDNSSGVSTFKAKFEALSADGLLLFKMNFNNDRGYTSSPKTLETFSVIYKGTVLGKDQVNSGEDGKPHDKLNQEDKARIQEVVFQHCIYDVLGVKLKDTPNSKWKYESWNVFGGTYETYIFSYPDVNKTICKKCEAIVNRNRNTNYEFKGLYVETVLLLLYHYRRVYDSSYQFEQCKEEYYKILDDPIGRISIETTPWLSISRSDGYSIGDSKTAQYDVLLYTSLYNKEYIDTLISQRKLITIFK